MVDRCIVVPKGWRIALTVRGKDYEYEGELSEFAKSFHYGTRGTGGMTHDDPDDRPKERFGGRVTLHAGGRACILSAAAGHSRESKMKRKGKNEEGVVADARQRCRTVHR
jgi:hypothetical protein